VPFAAGGRLWCSLLDIKDRVILMHGYSEYEVARLVERLVEADWVCADVGANSGEYTVLFALCAPQGRVYAFEPAGHIYPRLQANVAANRLAHVTTENVAVAAINGNCPFFLDRSAANTGLSSLSRQAWHGGENLEKIQVSCVTLDHYFASADRLDLIKIDVEGHEMDVLRGAEAVLRRLAPLIIFEFGTAGNLPDSEAPDFLQRLGYDLHCIRYDVARGAQLVPCPTLEADVLIRYAPRGPLNLVAVPRPRYGYPAPRLVAVSASS
jgi:FkbM family methyltransferase